MSGSVNYTHLGEFADILAIYEKSKTKNIEYAVLLFGTFSLIYIVM